MGLILQNINQIVTCAIGLEKYKSGKKMREIGLIENGNVKIVDDKIVKISKGKIKPTKDDVVIECENNVLMPGFIDAHTHLVFAGTREDEFAMRIEGKSYQEIANSGGGILSTVQKTRLAEKKDLKKSAREILNKFLKHGTTTVEIKSGYGLDFKNEIKLLEVIRELEVEELISIVPTFMGAHAVPPEFKNKKEEYLKLIVENMIPYVGRKKLAKYCDVFCEQNYFSVDEARYIFNAAEKNNLKLKLHSDEINNIGGTRLAKEFKISSIDHLEKINDKDLEILQKSKSVAVLLPGVSFNLNHGYAPARKIIDANIPVAIATDFNPGSCMNYSMPLTMTIASTQMQMTIEETINASTINAAAALDLSEKIGSIEVGKTADLILLEIPNYKYLNYHFGENHVKSVIKSGVILDL